MGLVGPILLGCLAIVAGAVFKILLDWEDIRPGAPIDRRETALFRQFYFAVDFVLLAIGLLLSSQGLRAVVTTQPGQAELNQTMADWHTALGLFYLVCLGLTILLWLFAGDDKRIPHGPKTRPYYEGGERKERTVVSPFWFRGLFSRAGLMTIIFGNLLGLFCLTLFVVFLKQAFGSTTP